MRGSLLLACMLALPSTSALAQAVSGSVSPLTAGAGIAAPESAGVLSENPAANVHTGTSSVEGGLFASRTDTAARYPGYPAERRSTTGFNPLLSSQALSASVGGKRLSLIVLPVPPMPIPEVEVKDIPIVVLGQPNAIDVTVSGKVRGGLGFMASYRLLQNFAVGVQAFYAEAQVDATVADHETGLDLAKISGSGSAFASRIGLFGQPVQRISVGLTTIPLIQGKGRLRSAAVPEAGVKIDDLPLPPLAFRRTFPTFGFGLGVSLPRLTLLADALYTRADKTPMPSPVEFGRVKKQDSYDAVEARLGAVAAVDSHKALLCGIRYVPATKGDGGLGPDSSTGFTFVDYIPIALGFAELTPLWEYTAGLRYSFGRTSKAVVDEDGKKRDKRLAFDRWRVASGIVYQRADRGIRENGEQPAVYHYRSLRIPVTVAYSF